MTQSARTAFFVGYLTIPGPLARLFWWLVPVVLSATLGAGLVVFVRQGAPGDQITAWPAETFTGYLELVPYPVLHVPPGPQYPDGRSVVLVRGNKSGADEMAAPFGGQVVSVRGVKLVRHEDADMITAFRIEPADPDATDPALLAWRPPAPVDLGPYTLKGELVDSKCYYGAMRPGDGKVHMACANLCMLGGVPPMYSLEHEDGDRSVLVLADHDGSALPFDYLDYTSLYLEARGRVERRGSLHILKVDPDGLSLL